jgi:hypothetical protein
MAIKVKGVTILDNPVVNPVNRVTDVLGYNIHRLNVRVELDGGRTAADQLPDEIPIEVMAREPALRRAGMSSMSGPFQTTAKRQGTTLTYTASVDPWKLAAFMKDVDFLNEVSTVVRHGGTSDAYFRSILSKGGWAVRGAATQPAAGKPDVTGNVQREEPDARTVFLAGGVELLEVSVPASSGLKVGPQAKSWIFVRSPADVFFYSGHGAWWNCNLLREQANHLYENWLSPEQILESWKRQTDVNSMPWDLDVLIINGCSVLGNTGPSELNAYEVTIPCAKRWQKLLFTQGGPLYAILSYRGTAPMDSNGGNLIAKEMAKAIVKDLRDDWDGYARRWVEINARYPQTRTAAAMDSSGYWYINQKMESATSTHGARELGGYDPRKPEGTIMGPGPIPSPPLSFGRR